MNLSNSKTTAATTTIKQSLDAWEIPEMAYDVFKAREKNLYFKLN